MAGALYLVPSVLGEEAAIDTIPRASLEILARLDHLVVETPKQARRFLSLAGVRLAERALDIAVLDEHTPDSRLPELLAPALAGKEVGLLSDAGCPGVADPGAKLVRLAHARGIRVLPLAGPSAILLALMGSGMNGQRFAFHGYLPVQPGKRDAVARTLERRARQENETQILIEAPYRNNRLLEALLRACAPDTLLCLATDLTLPTESIATRSIAQWRRDPPDIDRRPTVFLIGADASAPATAAPRLPPGARRRRGS